MTRRIALYARVSTEEQTPEPQLDALREYAERRGFKAVEYVPVALRDRAVDGRARHRAGSGTRIRDPGVASLAASCLRPRPVGVGVGEPELFDSSRERASDRKKSAFVEFGD